MRLLCSFSLWCWLSWLSKFGWLVEKVQKMLVLLTFFGRYRLYFLMWVEFIWYNSRICMLVIDNVVDFWTTLNLSHIKFIEPRKHHFRINLTFQCSNFSWLSFTLSLTNQVQHTHKPSSPTVILKRAKKSEVVQKCSFNGRCNVSPLNFCPVSAPGSYTQTSRGKR